MSTKDKKLLKDYSKEIGSIHPEELTVEKLIESHRSLREMSIRFHTADRQRYQQVYEEIQKKQQEEGLVPKRVFDGLIHDMQAIINEYTSSK